ncbi:MAG: phospholipase D-like domain-containing protein [Candidatus Bipolaricaulota bacterium]
MMTGRRVLFTLVIVCAGVVAWAATVTPLLTEPDTPEYLEAVVELLAEAEEEVLVMISDLRYYGPELPASAPAKALAQAASRGVEVRALVNLWRQPWDTQNQARELLEEAGAAFRWWEDPDGSLHAKALVVDGRYVLLGSSHWTWNALLDSVQVDLLVDSEKVAHVFVQLFGFLWEREDNVQVTYPEPPWPEEALLSLVQPPGTEVHLEILSRLISRSERSVEVLIYRMARYPGAWDSPSNLLLDELVAAVGRGVCVRVALEGGEEFMDEATVRGNRESAAYLLLSGVDVRLVPAGETMHAKLLVIDGRDVVVTSANWAYYSLARHAEAGVAVLGVPELARQLQGLFLRVWERSRRGVGAEAMRTERPRSTLLQPT